MVRPENVSRVNFIKTTLASCFLFLCCAAFLYFAFGSYNHDDKAAYQLLAYGDAADVPPTTKSVQNRSGLQKNIIFSSDGQAYELILRSEQVELILLKHEGSLELAEKMHDISCDLKKDDGVCVCSLTADQADYSAKQVLLMGNVIIKNDLGFIETDMLTMKPSENTKSISFDRVDVANGVFAHINGGGELLCDCATIYPKELSGDFRGGSAQPFVSYIEKKENAATPAWEIKSREMNIALKKMIGHGGNLIVSEIQASKDVSLEYNNLIATGDHAVYRYENTEDKTRFFGGTVTLTPSLENKLCQVRNGDSEAIYSERIDLDTETRNCVFTQAYGTFSGPNTTGEGIAFSADKLLWKNEGIIIMSGNSRISQSDMGQIDSEDIKIDLINLKGKWVLHSLQTQGDVVMVYNDRDKNLNHTLKCYGALKVDHQKMEAKLLSPKDSLGNVLPGKQMFFEDSRGDIYADRAFIKYEIMEGSFSPVRIVLEGNVKLANRLANSEKDPTQVKQYILAERVDFLPRTKEMTFKPAKGERVLLFDKTNDLQVSAAALKVIRDKATKKELFEGLGDVRFTFADQEFQRLRSHFNLEKDMKNAEKNGDTND